MAAGIKDWVQHFRIHSTTDLDFVIAQTIGWPIGMTRESPPEFRRRVLAAAVSYQLNLRSIDYALKRYVGSDNYENEEESLGDEVSDFLKKCAKVLATELKDLHTQDALTFGKFGSEVTLFKVPDVLDVARMISNRGLLLYQPP